MNIRGLVRTYIVFRSEDLSKLLDELAAFVVGCITAKLITSILFLILNSSSASPGSAG